MAYDNGYTGYAGYGQPANPSQLRNALAARMLQEGNDNSPIRSPWQGASRLGNALVGSMLLKKGMGGWNQGQNDLSNIANGGQQPPLAMTGQNSFGPGDPNGAPPPGPMMASPSPMIGDPMSGPNGGAMQPPAPPPGPMMASGPGGPPPGAMPPSGFLGHNGMAGDPLGGPNRPGQPPNFMEAPQPGPDQTAAILPALEAGIAKEESGGNYGAEGPVTKSGDRAYGKYQVMGSNVGPWTQEALGYAEDPKTFLHDKNAQEAVAGAKLSEYLSKTGNPADAASMWFTGHPLAQGAGMHDQLGTSGAQYAANATQVADNSPGGGMQYAGGQGLPPPPPQGGVNMEAVQRILSNPDADPQTRAFAMQMLQFYTMPQYQMLPARPDGSVYETDLRHPTAPPVQVLGPMKVPQWGVVAKNSDGSEQYGFIQPLDQQVTQPQGIGPSSLPPGAPAAAGPMPAPIGGVTASGGTPPPTQPGLPKGSEGPGLAPSALAAGDARIAALSNDPQWGNAALMAKAIAHGDMPLPTGNPQTKPEDVKVLSVLNRFYPGFDNKVAQSQLNTYNDYTDTDKQGATGWQIRSLNAAIEHAHNLSNLADQLAQYQGNSALLNQGGGFAADKLTSGKLAQLRNQYDAEAKIFVAETNKFLTGGEGSDAMRESMLKNLDVSLPNSLQQSGVDGYLQQMQGKAQTIQKGWHKVMGENRPDYPVLDPWNEGFLQDRGLLPKPAGAAAPSPTGAPARAPAGIGSLVPAANAGESPTQGTIPPAAANALRQHPDKAAEFDKKFGAGAAARVLGQ